MGKVLESSNDVIEVGDLVQQYTTGKTGVVIEIVEDRWVPPVCKVFYGYGEILQDFIDEFTKLNFN